MTDSSAPTTSNTELSSQRSEFAEGEMLAARRGFAFVFKCVVVMIVGLAAVTVFATVYVTVAPSDNFEAADKAIVAKLVQITFGNVLGASALFLGVVLSWLGVTATVHLNVTSNQTGSFGLNTTSPGVVLMIGGCLLLGLALYIPVGFYQMTESGSSTSGTIDTQQNNSTGTKTGTNNSNDTRFASGTKTITQVDTVYYTGVFPSTELGGALSSGTELEVVRHAGGELYEVKKDDGDVVLVSATSMLPVEKPGAEEERGGSELEQPGPLVTQGTRTITAVDVGRSFSLRDSIAIFADSNAELPLLADLAANTEVQVVGVERQKVRLRMADGSEAYAYKQAFEAAIMPPPEESQPPPERVPDGMPLEDRPPPEQIVKTTKSIQITAVDAGRRLSLWESIPFFSQVPAEPSAIAQGRLPARASLEVRSLEGDYVLVRNTADGAEVYVSKGALEMAGEELAPAPGANEHPPSEGETPSDDVADNGTEDDGTANQASTGPTDDGTKPDPSAGAGQPGKGGEIPIDVPDETLAPGTAVTTRERNVATDQQSNAVWIRRRSRCRRW